MLKSESIYRGSTIFAIGILYESDEWSDHKLADEIRSALEEHPETDVRMIDMRIPSCIDRALECNVLVSRVFASAVNRGNSCALENMDTLIGELEGTGILLINEARAHGFEVDKRSSTEALCKAGLSVPDIFQTALPDDMDPHRFVFPCVIKPNCSGRTTDTVIANDFAQAEAFLASAPEREFIAQEYIEPEYGFITRVEIVGGRVVLVVKRSIANNGLSAYRFGSTYEIYDDVPEVIIDEAEQAAGTLGFTFGSFDIIETNRGDFFIDANSVSNVSEDCTETFDMDLMKEYAKEIARIVKQARNMTV